METANPYTPQAKPQPNRLGRFMGVAIIILLIGGIWGTVSLIVIKEAAIDDTRSPQRVAYAFMNYVAQGDQDGAMGLVSAPDELSKMRISTAIALAKGKVKTADYVDYSLTSVNGYFIYDLQGSAYKYARVIVRGNDKQWRIVDFTVSTTPLQLIPH